jgi:hypothetical protein
MGCGWERSSPPRTSVAYSIGRSRVGMRSTAPWKAARLHPRDPCWAGKTWSCVVMAPILACGPGREPEARGHRWEAVACRPAARSLRRLLGSRSAGNRPVVSGAPHCASRTIPVRGAAEIPGRRSIPRSFRVEGPARARGPAVPRTALPSRQSEEGRQGLIGIGSRQLAPVGCV